MEVAVGAHVESADSSLKFCRRYKEEFAKVIACSWTDEAFRARLLSNPKAALEEMEIIVPQGFTMRIMEDTHPNTLTLTLPCKPKNLAEMSPKEQESVAEQTCFFLSP